MNRFMFTLGVMAFSMQLAVIAQPNQPPTYEVQIKRLPASNEGNYIELDQRGYQSNSSNQNNIPADFDRQSFDQKINAAIREGQNVRDTRPISPNNTTINETRAGRQGYNNVLQNTIERTLAIVKPDAVKSNHIGDIISRYENSGLRVAGIKMKRLTRDEASKFYAVHKDRPFYNDLVDFMSSGPVVIVVLEGNQAISKNRQLMGATDPSRADRGTIRADYANSTTQNAVHGSDSPESAQTEIDYFFEKNDLQSRY